MGVERPSGAALRAVADWLDECVTCGQIHHEHQMITTTIRGDTIVRQSWAGEDGHHYRRRVTAVGDLNSVPDRLRLAADDAEGVLDG